MYASILTHPEMKNCRYYDIEAHDIEESSISKFVLRYPTAFFMNNDSILAFKPCIKIDLLIDSPGPSSCKVADHDCRMQFCAGHSLHRIYFISGKWLSSFVGVARLRRGGSRRRIRICCAGRRSSSPCYNKDTM
jgi:hypothetical protein